MGGGINGTCPVLQGKWQTGPALESLSTQVDMGLRIGHLCPEGRCNDGSGIVTLEHETDCGAKAGSSKGIWAEK